MVDNMELYKVIYALRECNSGQWDEELFALPTVEGYLAGVCSQWDVSEEDLHNMIEKYWNTPVIVTIDKKYDSVDDARDELKNAVLDSLPEWATYHIDSDNSILGDMLDSIMEAAEHTFVCDRLGERVAVCSFHTEEGGYADGQEYFNAWLDGFDINPAFSYTLRSERGAHLPMNVSICVSKYGAAKLRELTYGDAAIGHIVYGIIQAKELPTNELRVLEQVLRWLEKHTVYLVGNVEQTVKDFLETHFNTATVKLSSRLNSSVLEVSMWREAGRVKQMTVADALHYALMNLTARQVNDTDIRCSTMGLLELVDDLYIVDGDDGETLIFKVDRALLL